MKPRLLLPVILAVLGWVLPRLGRWLLRRRRPEPRFRPPPPAMPAGPPSPLSRRPLWWRAPLVLIPGMSIALGVFLIAIAAPPILAAETRPTPAQPIPFDHALHAGKVGISCTYCHPTAATGATAGYPDLQTCMTCHVSVGQGQPGPEQVRLAWIKQEPINWQRVYREPDDVRFDHQAHVAAGIACTACHGDVTNQRQITQAQPLTMGQCIACHEERRAPTRCTTCHF